MLQVLMNLRNKNSTQFKAHNNKVNHQNLNQNHFHNILRLFDGSQNFLFTKSETMRDYYL